MQGFVIVAARVLTCQPRSPLSATRPHHVWCCCWRVTHTERKVLLPLLGVGLMCGVAAVAFLVIGIGYVALFVRGHECAYHIPPTSIVAPITAMWTTVVRAMLAAGTHRPLTQSSRHRL